MKSTKAMRDRIRELMPKAWDDYDHAVDCVLEDLETSLVRIEALEAALQGIIKMCDVRIHRLSLFDEIQHHARAALAPEQVSTSGLPPDFAA